MNVFDAVERWNNEETTEIVSHFVERLGEASGDAVVEMLVFNRYLSPYQQARFRDMMADALGVAK